MGRRPEFSVPPRKRQLPTVPGRYPPVWIGTSSGAVKSSMSWVNSLALRQLIVQDTFARLKAIF